MQNPAHITVANLPQNVEGGIKIHGFQSPVYDLPKNVVLLFTHLEGSEAVCQVEGRNTGVSIDSNTPLVELGSDEWRVEYPKTADVANA